MDAPLVKVCGVINLTNALACVAAGADWIGLNFHPPSPRSVDLTQAARLVAALQGRVELVGLFVDRPIVEVAATLATLPALRTIQLHGHEDLAYLAACRDLPTRPRVIRAYRLQTGADIAAMRADLAEATDRGVGPDAVLVDALVAGQFGGTGHSIPDAVLADLPGHPRLMLAGGLTPANVAERVQRIRPWAVDVASGVESAPGIKDPGAVAAFCRAARGS